jgi:hypothetical protein
MRRRCKRIPISAEVEKHVLLASRRRCCICYFLQRKDEERKGQLAHLSHDPSDSSFENIVWLCLEHHDAFDSRTAQSKGYTVAEVRAHRNHLYEHFRSVLPPSREEVDDEAEAVLFSGVKRKHQDELGFLANPWRFPLWQTANEPEYFAYKAGNRADGVCLIERINLPDGRIVVACIQTAGNPGNSITNCVEELCFQVCERFGIDPHKLVWLEHYDFIDPPEWDMVEFGTTPPTGAFADPKWIPMTERLWGDLRLKPKRRLISLRRDFKSKLTKKFPWEDGESLF